MTFEERKTKLRQILKEQNIDIILLYSTRNETGLSVWATGAVCNSSFHYYFVTKTDSGFIEVSYRVQDLKERTTEQIISFEDENTISSFLKQFLANYKRVGLAGPVPFNHIDTDSYTITDLTTNINNLLCVKNVEEIQTITHNASEVTKILNTVEKLIKPGISEIEIENIINASLYKVAEKYAFPLTVVSGDRLQNGTVGKASNRILQKNDWILIDIGAYKNGFYTDCTKMFFTGESNIQTDYQKLLLVQNRIIKSLQSGIRLEDIKNNYIKELQKENLPAETLEIPYLGHSIGFILHEEPNFYQEQSKDFKIQNGMIFTLEPEVVIDRHHIRVENMIQIKDGAALQIA